LTQRAFTEWHAEDGQVHSLVSGRLALLLALFPASRINAFSLFDYTFSGVVSLAIKNAAFNDSGPAKSDPLMLGEPFSAASLSNKPAQA